MKKFQNPKNKKGFTLIEIILVLILIGLITTLIVPFTISFIEKQKEKKMVIDIMTKVADLKRNSVSNLQLGKISLEDGFLIFYLDNQIINKIVSGKIFDMEHEITFNRNGISSGGKIQIKLSKNYNIIIENVSGIIKLETGNE